MNESFWKMEAISDSGVDTRRRLVYSNVIKNTTQSREKGLKKLVSPPPPLSLTTHWWLRSTPETPWLVGNDVTRLGEPINALETERAHRAPSSCIPMRCFLSLSLSRFLYALVSPSKKRWNGRRVAISESAGPALLLSGEPVRTVQSSPLRPWQLPSPAVVFFRVQRLHFQKPTRPLGHPGISAFLSFSSSPND